jgi:hypothetical protein
MIYPYNMFLTQYDVIFMSMDGFLSFFLYILGSRHPFFHKDFFIEKCIFDAVFFQNMVFGYLDFNSEPFSGWFSFQNFEFEKPMTVPNFCLKIHFFTKLMIWEAFSRFGK